MTQDLPAALRLVPMTEALARQTAGWSYGGSCALYDHPDWDTMVAQSWGLTKPVLREREFVALVDASGRAAGFLRYMAGTDDVCVGLGLRPDLCGRGVGAHAMTLLHEEAQRRYGSCRLRLEVRSFNERAIRCYEQAGWTRIGLTRQETVLGPGTFVVMQHVVAEP